MIFWKSEGQGLNLLVQEKRKCWPLVLHMNWMQTISFHQWRFYFTISHWDQRHLQTLVVCVKDGAWGYFQWNGGGCQTCGFWKNCKWVISVFNILKFFSEMSLLRLSRTITLNASTCVFLYPVDFGLNVEVSNLSISSSCLNLILQGKVF